MYTAGLALGVQGIATSLLGEAELPTSSPVQIHSMQIAIEGKMLVRSSGFRPICLGGKKKTHTMHADHR